MDLVNLCTSTGDHKKRVNKKNRNWQKRLQLRKTVVQPPAMQSEDKNGPKKIAEEREPRLSSKNPPQEAQQSRRMTNDGGSTLRFTCSQCKDSSEYAPKDLVRHFVEKHKGSPPVFSCHMCTFSTHEFSFLQVHLLSHKDTFSSCSMCKDNIQRTWPEFTAHLTMYHCLNGKYSCEMCQKFSTGDFRVFLEHIYGHNLNLEEAEDADQHTKGSNQTLRCQYCSFEAPEKWSISKHVKADHVCQIGNQRKAKRRVHSIAVKPGDAVPPKRTRLTRSSVRETCWLTQDCLSLPGREFLDKYCHLSDPQTTLAETQQFLMQSVAGETDDQKWTKALKTVLSNVPQDMNLYPSENGIMSNAQDLAVLTVKNKITVAQNGAAYPKRLKMRTATDKKAVCAEGGASNAQCAQDQNESSLKNQIPPQVENKPHDDISRFVVNRENQELKMDQEMEGHSGKLEGNGSSEGIHTSNKEKTSTSRVLPRSKTRRRRKRRAGFRKANKKPGGQALKLVLKKNPVKEQQWVSQSSLSPDNEGMELSDACVTLKETTEPSAVQQNKSSTADPPETSTLIPQSESVRPPEPEDLAGSKPVAFQSLHQEEHDDAEQYPCFLETEDKSRSADESICTNPRPASVTGVEMCHENAQLQKSLSHHLTEEEEEESPAAAAAIPQPATTPPDQLDLEDFCLDVSAQHKDQTVEGTENGEVPADSCPALLSSVHSPVGKAIQNQSSPAPGHQWQPIPKRQERTLTLVAINPSQLVKRPAGDQPVVVLNHPDADIPQVARIMEVVKRYREVQKVILSRSTLTALSAETDGPTEPQNEPAWQGNATVQERFTLKLKFRRLSRKKYEIVGAVSPSRDFVSKFPCWFCGRIFTSQETMMAHRQRHLMEWKRPNCESS